MVAEMKKLLVILFLIYSSIGPTIGSKCSKQYEPEASHQKYVTVVCLRMSSTSSLDYIEDNEALPLHIEVENSEIPVLSQNFFNSLSNITTLYLAGSQIEELSPSVFDSLNNLEVLNLTWNELKTIPGKIFEHSNKLQILDLSDNYINNLEQNCFSGLTNLEELLLDHNEITILTDGLPPTTLLDISHNPLEHFGADLSHTKINTLKLNNAKLKKIDFSLFPKQFTTVDLSRNLINSVENWDQLEGEYITLKWNQITDVQCYPQNVRRLCLTYNNIKSLQNSCVDTKELEVLDLGFNQLSEVHASNFLGLDNLRSLNLQNNLLTDLDEGSFVHCPKLEILDLALNKFQQMDLKALGCLHHLKNLYITRAHFAFLNASTIANATVLYFDHNDDDAIPVKTDSRSNFRDYCKQFPYHVVCHRRPSIQSGVLDYE